MPLRNILGTPIVGRKSFDAVVLFLILVSLAAFSLETLPDLPADAYWWLLVCEGVITLLFTVEYLLRSSAADRYRDYALSFFGMVDLLAILPFYLEFMGILEGDARFLRALRLLRVFEVFRLSGLDRALGDCIRALRFAWRPLVIAGILFAVLLFLAATGVWFFEREAQPQHFPSVVHSLWWSIITLTTVGYGDIVPITAGGRLFASAVALTGVGIVAVPAGIFASSLLQTNKLED